MKDLLLIVAIGILWLTPNFALVFMCSIREMWEDLWVSQNVFGKICANVFYLPAWIIAWVFTPLICILFWVLCPIYKLIKFIVKWLKPLYNKAMKLDM